MPRPLPFAAWLVIVAFCVSCSAPAQETDESPLKDVQVVRAFTKLEWPDWILGLDEGLPRDPRPVVITGAGDASGRMFVGTQYGVVFSFDNDPNASELTTFLDIRERIMPFKYRENEEGFLGLAFHPKFKENGEFFVNYTAYPTDEKPHLTRISRFRTKPGNPNEGDHETEEVLLEIEQPYWNHNGGTVVFGPDGYLYIGMGDGGWANDPHGNGQSLHTLLGKILRIDVDHKSEGQNYSIPADNPFANKPVTVRPEIWAWGIRNVWRLSFDRKTGVCWAADVGQNQWEEIDIIRGGGNYGWNVREGSRPFSDHRGPNPAVVAQTGQLIDPIWEYHHDVGKSITGGHVYRGQKLPELAGGYLYADYVTGQVWALWYDFQKQAVTANRTIRQAGSPVLTFGEDDEGEVYFTSEREIFTFAPGN